MRSLSNDIKYTKTDRKCIKLEIIEKSGINDITLQNPISIDLDTLEKIEECIKKYNYKYIYYKFDCGKFICSADSVDEVKTLFKEKNITKLDNLSIVVSNTYVEDLRIILERYSSSIEVEKVTSDTRCLSEDIEKIINDNNLEPKILRHPLRLSLLSGISLGIILSIISLQRSRIRFTIDSNNFIG